MSIAPFAYRLKKKNATWEYNELIPELPSLDREINRTKDKGAHQLVMGILCLHNVLSY